tara:strand:- start:291 stop:458 length:168 start_codon:yes stop_codon:yes gene_type:complete
MHLKVHLEELLFLQQVQVDYLHHIHRIRKGFLRPLLQNRQQLHLLHQHKLLEKLK